MQIGHDIGKIYYCIVPRRSKRCITQKWVIKGLNRGGVWLKKFKFIIKSIYTRI